MSMLESQLKKLGLTILGGFFPHSTEAIAGRQAGQVKQVLLIGNAGSALWPAVKKWAEAHPGPDPMNRWTEAVLTPLARTCGAEIAFPFQGPPWLPFTQWALRCPDLSPSPLGLTIHVEFGLWHAFRGALLLSSSITTAATGAASNVASAPCTTCSKKPCLSACPVDAFGKDGYAYDACREHVAAGAGNQCYQTGCLARHACPVGQDYAYDQSHAAFHMRAFLGRDHDLPVT